MSIRENLIKRLGGNIAVPKAAPRGGLSIASIIAGENTSRGNMETYLKAFGEDPWLFQVVSKVSQSVGEVVWHLYQTNKNGEREEVEGPHPLKDLLNRPNSNQTGQDLIELSEKFSLLTGASYWSYRKAKGSNQMELREVPSPWLTAVPDANGDVVGYKWERGKEVDTYARDEIIPFVNTDPYNLMGGVSATQTIGLEIDMFNFARQTNRMFFYRGADPGLIISFKNSVDQQRLDEMKQKWAATHRSYGNAHDPAFFGDDVTVTKEGETHRDMEFNVGMENIRKTELGAHCVSYSILGGTEAVARANADAQHYQFASMTVRPRLQFRRRKLNEWLVPLFGDNLELDFDDPAPEDEQAKAVLVDGHVKSSLFSIEEGRQELDMGDINPTDHFMVPINMMIVTGADIMSNSSIQAPPAQLPSAQLPPGKSVKKKVNGAAVWQAYIRRTEAYEKPVVKAVQTYLNEQKAEAVKNLAGSRHDTLIDKAKFKKRYVELVRPALTHAITDSYANSQETHGGKSLTVIPLLINKYVLEWLQNRLNWAAEELGTTTEQALSEFLMASYANGLSIDQMVSQMTDLFTFSPARAQAIARTETIAAAVQGDIQGMKEAGVKSVTYMAAEDERTCEDCSDMDGEEFDISDSEGIIPLHVNCRCTWLSNFGD